MTRRVTRRAYGVALGLIASWSTAPLLAEEQPAIPALRPVAEPAKLELQPAAKPEADDNVHTECVQERYPSRTLKVERHVGQDKQGNYYNHGPYVQWSEDGRLMGRGQYRHGKIEGKWVRWYSAEEIAATFPDFADLGFEAPFTSQGEFVKGKLNGAWTIVDAKKRPICAWEFEEGRRHGVSNWWFADGQKFREVEYRAGELDGCVRQWSADGELAKEDHYVNGYRHGVKTEYYSTGETKSECETFFAKEVYVSVDDWWNGTTEVTVIGKVGRDQRHGVYQGWNREGQKVLTGRYVDDRPDGEFTWWHDNGNKAIEGRYVEGKQHGAWTWWYANGMKEIAGEYVMGYEDGRWKQWSAEGRITESMRILPASEMHAAQAKKAEAVAPTPIEQTASEEGPTLMQLKPVAEPQTVAELPKLQVPPTEGESVVTAPKPPVDLQQVNFASRLPKPEQAPKLVPVAPGILKMEAPAAVETTNVGPTLKVPTVRPVER